MKVRRIRRREEGEKGRWRRIRRKDKEKNGEGGIRIRRRFQGQTLKLKGVVSANINM